MGVVEIDVCVACGGVFLDKSEAVLYFRQVRERPVQERSTAGKVVTDTVTVVDTADVVFSLGHFISKLLH